MQRTPAPAVAHARARVAALTIHHGRDDERTEAARRDLRVERVAITLQELVASAPAPTAEQLDRLRSLLPAPVVTDRRAG